MAMKAKTSTVKESLTKKEKADIKKIAEKVKIDHKGAEKPQLLQKIKPEEKVILGTIPVVKWTVYTQSNKGVKTLTVSRIVDTVNLEAPAAKAKVIKDSCKNDPGKFDKIIHEVLDTELRKVGFYTHDLVAIDAMKERILKKIEQLNLDFEYCDEAHTLGYVRAELSAISHILNELRAHRDMFLFYSKEVDEKFRILPDMKKFTVKNRKFVPTEKPSIPKKSPSTK